MIALDNESSIVVSVGDRVFFRRLGKRELEFDDVVQVIDSRPVRVIRLKDGTLMLESGILSFLPND
jgi:hypothetical protein